MASVRFCTQGCQFWSVRSGGPSRALPCSQPRAPFNTPNLCAIGIWRPKAAPRLEMRTYGSRAAHKGCHEATRSHSAQRLDDRDDIRPVSLDDNACSASRFWRLKGKFRIALFASHGLDAGQNSRRFLNRREPKNDHISEAVEQKAKSDGRR